MTQMFKRISRSELVYRRLKADDQAKVYGALRWLANERGFKPGWAAFKFKMIFEEWPSDKVKKDASMADRPSSDLLTWLSKEDRNYGQRLKRKEAKTAAEAKNASAASLSRIEGILDKIEANPLSRDPDLNEEAAEALDRVSVIEQRMARNMADHARFVECSGGKPKSKS